MTGQAVPVIRHHLPQVPTLTHHPRMAMSKTNNHSVSTDAHPQQYANIVPMETVCQGQSFAASTDLLPGADLAPHLPTLPADDASVLPHSSCGGHSQVSAPIPSPPIKLRIRRSFHEGTLCSRATPPPQSHEQSALSAAGVPMHSVAPPPSLPVSVATGFAPTRFGRAKTKGDIKKQLMEKKRDRKMMEASRDAAIKQEAAVSRVGTVTQFNYCYSSN